MTTPPDPGMPPPEPPYIPIRCSEPGGPEGMLRAQEPVNLKPRLSAWMQAYQRRRRWIEDEWRRISDAIYAEAARQEADGRNATPASDAAE